MKRYICLILSAVLLLTLSACGTSVDAPSTPTPAPTESPTPEPTPPPYIAPLSGEGIGIDLSRKRPWAVMLNNLKQSLPQRGVSEAEILYEIPAEGGVTRMMGIFGDVSGIEALGSMRSIRPYYADVGLAYDAITVHAGGSAASYDEMAIYGVDHLDGVLGAYGDNEVFYRDPDRMKFGLEHSMFALGAGLLAAAAYKGIELEHGVTDYGLSFSQKATKQCAEDAEYVCLTYSGGKETIFRYLPEEERYAVYQYGEAYIDANDGEQLTFTNVLALFTGMAVLDDVGRLYVRTTGSGDGVFCCGGRAVDITWERSSVTDCFLYYLKDGTPLNLAAGHTFIGVIGGNRNSVTFEEDDK